MNTLVNTNGRLCKTEVNRSYNTAMGGTKNQPELSYSRSKIVTYKDETHNDFRWGVSGIPECTRYRFPTLGSDHASFVKARADPLASNLYNDMVLLWNELNIEKRMNGLVESEQHTSEESIEDAYQRLYSAAVRHREELTATLRDAGLENAQPFEGSWRTRDEDVGDGGRDEPELVAYDHEVQHPDQTTDSDATSITGDRQTDLQEVVGAQLTSFVPDVCYDVKDTLCQLDGGFDSYAEMNIKEIDKHFQDLEDYSQEILSQNDDVANGTHHKELCGLNTGNEESSKASSRLLSCHSTKSETMTNGSQRTVMNRSDSPYNEETFNTEYHSSRLDSGLHDVSCPYEDDDNDEDDQDDKKDCSSQAPNDAVQEEADLRQESQICNETNNNEGQHLASYKNDSAFSESYSRESFQDSELLMVNRSEQLYSLNDSVFNTSSCELSPIRHRSVSYFDDKLPQENAFPHMQHAMGEPNVGNTIFASEPSHLEQEPFSPSFASSPSYDQNQRKVSTSLTPLTPIGRNFHSLQREEYQNPTQPCFFTPAIKETHTKQLDTHQRPATNEKQNRLSVDVPLSIATREMDHSFRNWGEEFCILPMITSTNHSDLPKLDNSSGGVKCHAPDCGKTMDLNVARHLYKNCHNCRGTYYCGRACRRRDWERHKRHVCHGSRVSSACKRVINLCGRNPHVKAALTRVAKRGYLSMGRGCVMFGFPDLSSADGFLRHGLNPATTSIEISETNASHYNGLELLPIYVGILELQNSKMFGGKETKEHLIELCQTYNPDEKFLLNVGVGVRWDRSKSGELQNGRENRDICSSGQANRSCLNDHNISYLNGSSSCLYSSSSPVDVFSLREASQDNGYSSFSESNTPRNRRKRKQKISRSRSSSFGSDDFGYGSLGDVRENLPSYHLSSSSGDCAPIGINTENHDITSKGRPTQILSPSYFSPPLNEGKDIVYYSNTGPNPKCPIVQKCICLRLYTPQFSNLMKESYKTAAESYISGRKNNLDFITAIKSNQEQWRWRCGPTLILTSVPGSWYEAQEESRLAECLRKSRLTASTHDQESGIPNATDFPTATTGSYDDIKIIHKKCRELCFANIQKRLRQRGVSLRQQFPEIYSELVSYVAGDAEHFPSRIIFPVSKHGKGRMFTCVLMPDAEPDLRWTQSGELLETLDISKRNVYGPFLESRLGKQPTSDSKFHSVSNSSSGTGFKDLDELIDSVLRLKYDEEYPAPSIEKMQDSDTSPKPKENKNILQPEQHTCSKTKIRSNTIQEKQLKEHTHSPEQAISRLQQICPFCHRPFLGVHQSTQGTIMSTQLNSSKTDVIKRHARIPGLLQHCPTSLHSRRQFNTNFPIFHLDQDILEDLLTSNKDSSSHPHPQSNRKSLSSLVLGHLACQSLLSQIKLQSYFNNSQQTESGQTLQCPNSSLSSQVNKAQNCNSWNTNNNCEWKQNCPSSQNTSLHTPSNNTFNSSNSKSNLSHKHPRELSYTKKTNRVPSPTTHTPTPERNLSNKNPYAVNSPVLQQQSNKPTQTRCIRVTSSSAHHHVDSIINSWQNEHPHTITQSTTKPLWSCDLCSDQHPHNHRRQGIPLSQSKPHDAKDLQNQPCYSGKPSSQMPGERSKCHNRGVNDSSPLQSPHPNETYEKKKHLNAHYHLLHSSSDNKISTCENGLSDSNQRRHVHNLQSDW